jgi:hypothetical protein
MPTQKSSRSDSRLAETGAAPRIIDFNTLKIDCRRTKIKAHLPLASGKREDAEARCALARTFCAADLLEEFQ